MVARSLAKRVRQSGARVISGVRDADELAELTSDDTRSHRIIPMQRPGVLNASADALVVGGLGFTRMRYGAPVVVIPGDASSSEFLFPLSVGGRGHLRYGGAGVAVGPHDAAIIPPYRAFRSELSESFDQVIVRASQARVEHAVARLTAGEVSTLDVHAQTFAPGAGTMLQLEAVAALGADAGASGTHAARAADVALESVLLSIPTVRQLLPERGSAGSARLRRAMRHMLDHLAEPMTVVGVAESVHVSPRALQASFRDELGTTFTAWLRERRLERAWERLAADPHATIAEVAFASGFGHQGEFNAHFRMKFGMLPSAVTRELAANRAAPSPGSDR
ncbi:MAG: AraC family transcriptional regulator [Microbacteriaceae bacterium]|nr:AraC family transcriptional regulator [Microbacteriaceae bacterium]